MAHAVPEVAVLREEEGGAEVRSREGGAVPLGQRVEETFLGRRLRVLPEGVEELVLAFRRPPEEEERRPLGGGRGRAGDEREAFGVGLENDARGGVALHQAGAGGEHDVAFGGAEDVRLPEGDEILRVPVGYHSMDKGVLDHAGGEGEEEWEWHRDVRIEKDFAKILCTLCQKLSWTIRNLPAPQTP